jgi:hypothetical protein
MAIYLNNNVGVKLATSAAPTTPSIDISSYVTGITLTQSFEELDVTSMGQSYRAFVKGLNTAQLQIDFLNDWAAAQVMTTLNAAYGQTISVSMITVKANGGTPVAVSATNPSYQFSILVNNLTPVGSGGVGDEAASSITFTVNSDVTVSTTVAF